MDDLDFKKYIKYKLKYLELKQNKQSGGADESVEEKKKEGSLTPGTPSSRSPPKYQSDSGYLSSAQDNSLQARDIGSPVGSINFPVLKPEEARDRVDAVLAESKQVRDRVDAARAKADAETGTELGPPLLGKSSRSQKGIYKRSEVDDEFYRTLDKLRQTTEEARAVRIRAQEERAEAAEREVRKAREAAAINRLIEEAGELFPILLNILKKPDEQIIILKHMQKYREMNNPHINNSIVRIERILGHNEQVNSSDSPIAAINKIEIGNYIIDEILFIKYIEKLYGNIILLLRSNTTSQQGGSSDEVQEDEPTQEEVFNLLKGQPEGAGISTLRKFKDDKIIKTEYKGYFDYFFEHRAEIKNIKIKNQVILDMIRKEPKQAYKLDLDELTPVGKSFNDFDKTKSIIQEAKEIQLQLQQTYQALFIRSTITSYSKHFKIGHTVNSKGRFLTLVPVCLNKNCYTPISGTAQQCPYCMKRNVKEFNRTFKSMEIDGLIKDGEPVPGALPRNEDERRIISFTNTPNSKLMWMAGNCPALLNHDYEGNPKYTEDQIQFIDRQLKQPLDYPYMQLEQIERYELKRHKVLNCQNCDGNNRRNNLDKFFKCTQNSYQEKRLLFNLAIMGINPVENRILITQLVAILNKYHILNLPKTIAEIQYLVIQFGEGNPNELHTAELYAIDYGRKRRAGQKKSKEDEEEGEEDDGEEEYEEGDEVGEVDEQAQKKDEAVSRRVVRKFRVCPTPEQNWQEHSLYELNRIFQEDHIEGIHQLNISENMWSLCSVCHTIKTIYCGDNNTGSEYKNDEIPSNLDDYISILKNLIDTIHSENPDLNTVQLPPYPSATTAPEAPVAALISGNEPVLVTVTANTTAKEPEKKSEKEPEKKSEKEPEKEPVSSRLRSRPNN